MNKSTEIWCAEWDLHLLLESQTFTGLKDVSAAHFWLEFTLDYHARAPVKIELTVLALVFFITLQYHVSFFPVELLSTVLHVLPRYISRIRLPLLFPRSKMATHTFSYNVSFGDEALSVQFDEEFAISTPMKIGRASCRERV